MSRLINKTTKLIGKEKILCLTNLFLNLSGRPPRVERNRYRADNPSYIQALNYLENNEHLIKTEDNGNTYAVSPFALPLIHTEKSKDLIAKMDIIFQYLRVFYEKNLSAPISVEKILSDTDLPEQETIEALYYLAEASIWSGKSNGFPYDPQSHINICESVLLKKDILHLLTEFYPSRIARLKGKSQPHWAASYQANKGNQFTSAIKKFPLAAIAGTASIIIGLATFLNSTSYLWDLAKAIFGN